MADKSGQASLGKAVLFLDVDDSALRKGVQEARKYVDQQLGARGTGTRATGGRSSTPRTTGATGGAGRATQTDRSAATRVITYNLGNRLNALEERGVNVAEARAKLERAAKATNQGRLETARAQNKLAREFVTIEERRLRGSSRIGRQLADPIDAAFQAQKKTYSLTQQLQSLEASGVQTEQLRARLGQITTAQAQNRYGLAKQLSSQLDLDLRKERDKLRLQQKQKQERAADIQEGRRLGQLNVSPVRGGVGFPGSPKAKEEEAKKAEQGERKRNKAFNESLNLQKKEEGLRSRINRLELAGVDTASLRNQLGELGLRTSNVNLDSAKRQAGILDLLVQKEENKLKLQKEQEKAGKKVSTGGTRQPAAVTQTTTAEDKRISLLRRQENLDRRIQSLGNEGVNIEQLRNRLSAASLKGTSDNLGISRRLTAELDLQVLREENKLKLQKEQERLGKKKSPAAVRGGGGGGGDGGGRLSSALIGGAFPLLFGQGVGASVGGALGGALGGSKLGFGLSLVGTFLGAAFDTAIQKAQVLATALESPIRNFEALAEAGLISSKSLEGQIRALLEVGRNAEAAALLEQDLADAPDTDNAKKLEAATKDLNNAWNDLSITLANFFAGPLADILRAQNLVYRGSNKTDFSNVDAEIAAAVEAARRQILAEKRTETAKQFDVDIVKAQLDNDKLRTLELQKQKLELDKINELSLYNAKNASDQIRIDAINTKFKIAELKLEQEITKERERRAGLRQKLKVEEGAFGRTPAADKALIVALELENVRRQFGTSSIEFRVALQEGANSLLDSAKQSAEYLRDSFRELRDLRLGNLRFIPQEQRQQLIQAELQRGLPEAQRRGVALRGLEDLFAFNKFVEQERASLQKVDDAQRNMADANIALNSTIVQNTGAAGKLAEVMNRLVDKSWTVYVQAPGQNVATAINLQAQLGS